MCYAGCPYERKGGKRDGECKGMESWKHKNAYCYEDMRDDEAPEYRTTGLTQKGMVRNEAER